MDLYKPLASIAALRLELKFSPIKPGLEVIESSFRFETLWFIWHEPPWSPMGRHDLTLNKSRESLPPSLPPTSPLLFYSNPLHVFLTCKQDQIILGRSDSCHVRNVLDNPLRLNGVTVIQRTRKARTGSLSRAIV